MWALILALAGLVLVAGEHDGEHFDLIAGYIPGSDVVPHSRVDLDQQAMEAALAEAVPDFATAKHWYSVGGNSIKSGSTNRTIKGFSTGAQGKMYDNCPGCPYKTYEAFYGYYGDFDYADRLVSAALDGADMAFASGRHGPNNFASLGPAARIEAAKKGSAYMNVWMYVIREFEDAIDDCTSCTGDNCNEFSLNGGSVHAWDEGVAFYAGSLEGASGSPSGKLVWRLAEKRCANFGTCGLNGGETSGTSQINHLLLAQFQEGERLLQTGQCDRVRPVVDEIISLMTVPLVQGSLRYAYKIGEQPEERSQKNAAEGAIFTAAVLPLVHECDAAAAATISADMKFGLFDQGDLPDFQAVKAAFESTYACLGITCEHVGGLVDADGDPLHAMTAPCDGSGSGGAGSDRSGGSSSSGDSTGAIVGATIGGCAAGLLAGGYLLYRRRRAKLSDPVPVDMVVSSSDYSKAAPGRIGINSPHATGVTLSQEVDARV